MSEGHELAQRKRVTAAEISKYPLIGIDPEDPYGRIMAGIFAQRSLSYDVTIRARFGTTVFALVKHGLGIAVLDEFTVAETPLAGVVKIAIAEPTEFQTYFAYRKDATLSSFCEFFMSALRAEMQGKPMQNSSKLPVRGRSRAAGKK